jgi:hypothetical protein
MCDRPWPPSARFHGTAQQDHQPELAIAGEQDIQIRNDDHVDLTRAIFSRPLAAYPTMVATIDGGTSEIMKTIIAREVTGLRT